MEVYRIEKRAFLPTMLAGIPGEKFSFRWNTRGNPIVYTAQTRSLVLIEKMANIGMRYGGIPPAFVMTIIDIPNGQYRQIDSNSLPKDWNLSNEYHIQAQKLGDAFVSTNDLALLVPSVIVQGEFNVLLNPTALLNHRVGFQTEEIDTRLQSP